MCKISAEQAGDDQDQRTNTHAHVVALVLTGIFNTQQNCVLFLPLNAKQKDKKIRLRDKICSPPRSWGYWMAG